MPRLGVASHRDAILPRSPIHFPPAITDINAFFAEELVGIRRPPTARAAAMQPQRLVGGNVGYIELHGFSGSPDAGPTAVAAMNFVAGTDALMFDLRANGGGSPAMIGLLSSYLFDDVVHLNDFYIRERDEHRQLWTSPHVHGQRYGNTKPV